MTWRGEVPWTLGTQWEAGVDRLVSLGFFLAL